MSIVRRGHYPGAAILCAVRRETAGRERCRCPRQIAASASQDPGRVCRPRADRRRHRAAARKRWRPLERRSGRKCAPAFDSDNHSATTGQCAPEPNRHGANQSNPFHSVPDATSSRDPHPETAPHHPAAGDADDSRAARDRTASGDAHDSLADPGLGATGKNAAASEPGTAGHPAHARSSDAGSPLRPPAPVSLLCHGLHRLRCLGMGAKRLRNRSPRLRRTRSRWRRYRLQRSAAWIRSRLLD